MKKRSDVIAVVDIGSFKTACAVAKYNLATEQMEILGCSYQMSRGVKSGKIIDMNQASQVLSEVIATVEEEANTKIEDVLVSISGGKIISQVITSRVSISDHHVKEKDVNKVIKQALDSIDQEKFEIIHYIPTEFIINEISGVSNPVGMVGNKLTAKINVILVPVSIVNNLDNCFSRSQLNISDIVVGPYASGLGVLTQQEKENGVTLIEIGSQITSIAVYDKSVIKFIDTIPIGSHHISNDIAHAFNITFNQAERIKVLYGSMEVNEDDDKTFIDFETDEGILVDQNITKRHLAEIIIPRVDEIVDLVIEKIKGVNYQYNNQNVVITGGTANLYGIDKYLADRINRKVHVGTPLPVLNAKDYNIFENNPTMATLAGLINYSIKKQMMMKDNILISGSNNLITKIKNLIFKKAG